MGGFARCVAAGTSRQGGCESDDQVSADRRDRVCEMSFGTDGRRLGVDDLWEYQTSRIYRPLRGEAWPARRSRRHKPRCTAWRDGGSRASRALHSVPGPVPVSAPGNRARCRLVAWIGGAGALRPIHVPGHAMRTYSGRPSSSIRFSTPTAMAMCGRPLWCKEKMEDQQFGQVQSCVRPRKMRYA